MKRTKEWWASLTKLERIMLVRLERANANPIGGNDYIPDGMNECAYCGTPCYSGLCPPDNNELLRIIKKADTAVSC